jgi:hypothetical protein
MPLSPLFFFFTKANINCLSVALQSPSVWRRRPRSRSRSYQEHDSTPLNRSCWPSKSASSIRP